MELAKDSPSTKLWSSGKYALLEKVSSGQVMLWVLFANFVARFFTFPPPLPWHHLTKTATSPAKKNYVTKSYIPCLLHNSLIWLFFQQYIRLGTFAFCHWFAIKQSLFWWEISVICVLREKDFLRHIHSNPPLSTTDRNTIPLA